jgi:acetyl-CoA carboxylase biotin carboxyl carrier protein
MMADGELRELRAEADRLIAAVPWQVRKVKLRAGGLALEIEWTPAPAAGQAMPAPPAPAPVVEEPEGTLVRAPLVGTFYAAPEPGAEPFVTVGAPVVEGQVVAIVEAMKMMNELHAPASGTVTEILVSDAEPVEYEQPLIRIGADP